MFDQAEFEKALVTPRLRQPIPEFLPGNRGGGKIRVVTEPAPYFPRLTSLGCSAIILPE